MLVLHAHHEFLQKHLNIWKKLEDADKREPSCDSLVGLQAGELYKQRLNATGLFLFKSGSEGVLELEDVKK